MQADRLHAAQRLAELFHCVVNLKGSGSIIAAPEQRRFLDAAQSLADLPAGRLGELNVVASPDRLGAPVPHGIFDWS